MAGLWLILCRLGILAALAASGALYMHYADPAAATFCGPDSGCESVRRSGLSYLGTRYVSLPLVGLVAYGTVMWASLARERRTLHLRLAGAGGALGLALLGAQALWIGEFCWLCVIADTAAITVAITAWLAGRDADAPDRLRPTAWALLAAIAVAAPMIWTVARPAPPVPTVIRDLYVPDKINVVEFMDFQCPFCRKYHATLKRVMTSYPEGDVNFVRQHVPLDKHQQARPAARAAICAAADGKAEVLADRLVEIDLKLQSIRRAAVEMGIDMAAFDRCMGADETDASIDRQTERLQTAGMQGLPTTYVEGTRFVGAVSEEALRDAFERAVRKETESGIPGSAFVLLILLLGGAVAWWGRNPDATVSNDAERPSDTA